MSAPGKIVVRESTSLPTVGCTLKWTLEGISEYRFNTLPLQNAGITMQEMGFANGDGRWRIGLRPCVCEPQGQNPVLSYETRSKRCFLTAYLKLTDTEPGSRLYTGEQTFVAKYQISLATGKLQSKKLLERDIGTALFSNEQRLWGVSKLISHEQLFRKIQEDSLTISIDIIMQTDSVSHRVCHIPLDPQSYRGKFYERQTEFFRSIRHPNVADFLLRSSDGQDFPVIRCLLMAHSPVFAAMLAHDSQEKQQSRCEMNDVDAESAGILLDYVYGCELEKVTCCNAEKVLIMADKYGITYLRSYCEQRLAHGVTAANAAGYLPLVKQLDLGVLKDAVMYMLGSKITSEAAADEEHEGRSSETVELGKASVTESKENYDLRNNALNTGYFMVGYCFVSTALAAVFYFFLNVV